MKIHHISFSSDQCKISVEIINIPALHQDFLTSQGHITFSGCFRKYQRAKISVKMSKSLVGVHARQTQISTLLMVFMAWVWTESHRDVISRKLLSPSAPMFTHKIMKTRSNSPSPLYSRLLSDAAQTNFINIDDEIGTVCCACVPFARPPDVCSLSLVHIAGPRRWEKTQTWECRPQSAVCEWIYGDVRAAATQLVRLKTWSGVNSRHINLNQWVRLQILLSQSL